MLKVCRRCCKEKPQEDYYKDKRYSDGRQVYCKDCMKEGMKERRASKKYQQDKTVRKTIKEMIKSHALIEGIEPVKCSSCGEMKYPSEFYNDVHSSTGKKSACIECTQPQKRKKKVTVRRKKKDYDITKALQYHSEEDRALLLCKLESLSESQAKKQAHAWINLQDEELKRAVCVYASMEYFEREEFSSAVLEEEQRIKEEIEEENRKILEKVMFND